MTVKQLIKILQGVDGKRHVVLSIDPEGNGFNILADDGYSLNYRFKDGEIGEDDEMKGGVPCVVLWPS